MSRKKNRSARPETASSTAILPESAVTGLSSPKVKVMTVTSPTRADIKKPERFWLEVEAVRMARWLGSLQIAVFGLSLFAIVLIIGTMVESWYTGKIAQELVYRTWWFTLLLTVLGINIFFAAVKKWPWKKHQTGFLITHLGLITMVSGGIFNSLFGTDAMMTLIDTERADVQQEWGLKQTDNKAIDKDESIIQVSQRKNGKDESLTYAFRPGSLPWRSDEHLQRNVHPLLAALDWLANPLPRSWRADLGRGAELEVLAYYPHARLQKYSKAGDKDGQTFPALRFSLTSPFAGSFPDHWLAYRTQDQVSNMGPAAAEFLGPCPPDMLDEFLQPPSARELGIKGHLALRIRGQTIRLRVDDAAGEQSVANTGWKVKILDWIPDPADQRGTGLPTQPTVEFSLTSPEGKTTRWFALARYAGVMLPTQEKGEPLGEEAHVWYHFPDTRWGSKQTRGVLQFVVSDGDKLYYRSFHSAKGEKEEEKEFRFEKSGEVKEGKGSYDIWKGMNWKFEVNEFLPRAVARDRYVPENLRPGLEGVSGVVQALRCRLTVGKESKEFWVGQIESRPSEITVGNETYKVSYGVHAIDVGFDVTLKRAEQRVDDGTQQAASFSSYVLLKDPKHKVEQDYWVTMNQPLEYGGYKFFQSNFQTLELDQVSKMPISFSGFTVSSDPGLWMKYIGSTMLALGIVCMFYMKAYFFKPRGRKVPGLDPNLEGGHA